MTTIAFDGHLLAADTRGTWSGVPLICHKIHDCGDYVYASVGSAESSIRIEHWLREGANPPAADFELEEGGSWGIAIHVPSRKLFRVAGKRSVLVPIQEKQTADGSGRDFALAAMALGKSAIDAVRLAMRFDVSTGGDIDVFALSAATRWTVSCGSGDADTCERKET